MTYILKVENLSKIYAMGRAANQQETLFGKIANKAKQLFTQPPPLPVSAPRKGSIISPEQQEGLPAHHFWALRDISFSITPGERIGIIGQNGSGKSTLLKILSRITAPSHGEFRYKGHLISLLEVGTGFHVELSGRDNIFLNASINGMNRQQINALYENIVEFSELGEQINTPVKRYSSGMYMRLAFAVAAFLESDILLMDEVLAVGDSAFQEKCKKKMLDLSNSGRTVIFVSHDMDSIRMICNKTIEICHGRIKEIKPLPKYTPPPTPVLDNPVRIEAETQTDWATLLNQHSLGPKLKFLALHVLNQAGQPALYFKRDEAIICQLQLKLIDSNPALMLELIVSSAGGIDVFCVRKDMHYSNPGVYQEQLCIPKHLLNCGDYHISMAWYGLEGQVCRGHVKACAKFTVQPLSSDEPAWPAVLIRPLLELKTQESYEVEEI